MTTSELATTRFCTRCGHELVDGACPTCTPVPTTGARSVVTPPASEATRNSARRSRPALAVIALTLTALVALGLAATALVQSSATRHALQRTDAALKDSKQQQAALAQQVQDLSAAHQQLQQTVTGLQNRLDKTPNDAAVVKTAARSVFTILTDTGSGSGFVVANTAGQARLVTNFHVVADGYVNGSRAVTVQRGQLSYPGRVVDVSESNDLAVIAVDQALPALPVATRRPAIGDALLVLGSPLGLGGTVTSGIASAYRNDHGLTYLQFSAPISPGNSGGPVINEHGRVVGVSVMKMVGDGAEGLSFAIPSSRLCAALSVC